MIVMLYIIDFCKIVIYLQKWLFYIVGGFGYDKEKKKTIGSAGFMLW